MLFYFPLKYTFLKCTLVGFPGDAGGKELNCVVKIYKSV